MDLVKNLIHFKIGKEKKRGTFKIVQSYLIVSQPVLLHREFNFLN